MRSCGGRLFAPVAAAAQGGFGFSERLGQVPGKLLMHVGKSQAVSWFDLRRVYRLVGEVRELRTDAGAWKRRAVDGLIELLGGKQGGSIYYRQFTATGDVQAADYVGAGWADAEAEEAWVEHIQEGGFRQDTVLDELSRRPQALAAGVRHELVEDDVYFGDPLIRDIVRAGDVGSLVAGFYRRGDGTDAHGLVVHRAEKDRPFNARQRRMLHVFLYELRRLDRQGLLVWAVDGIDEPTFEEPAGNSAVAKVQALPPRLRGLLGWLLRGEAPSRIAYHTSLSEQTVRTYTKRLYQRMGVSSREELMAMFIPDAVKDGIGDEGGD